LSAVAPSTAPLGRPHAALGRVPGTVAQSLILSRYQLRNYLRSLRFVLMMTIVGVLGLILTLVLLHFRPGGLIGNPDDFYGSLWAGGVGIVIVFAGIIFGGDAIAGEFQNKTGYFLMGLPVRRPSVYVGKFIAAFAASFVAVLFYLAILLGNGIYYLGADAFPVALFESFAIAVVYLLALLGAVFLFSSLFKNSLYAVLVVAVLFLFGFTLLQALVSQLIQTEPWFIITYANQVIQYPFLAVPPPHVTTSPFGGGTAYNPTYVEGLVIMAGYFVLTALGGLALFGREEFT
jgi:ABC-2 type transport system permease protein